MNGSQLKKKVKELFGQGRENIVLLTTTNDHRIDELLQGAVYVFEHFFGGRIYGYYLVGSYANGTAVSTSDIDIHPVFKGDFHTPDEEIWCIK